MSNARWVEMPAPQYGSLGMAGTGTYPTNPPPTHPPKQWAAVDDADQILATVNTDGFGQWTAGVTGQSGGPYPTAAGGQKYGMFISESGAKARVEQWLSPQYTFPRASNATGWTAVGP